MDRWTTKARVKLMPQLLGCDMSKSDQAKDQA